MFLRLELYCVFFSKTSITIHLYESRATRARCARGTQEIRDKHFFIARARTFDTHACALRARAGFSCAIAPLFLSQSLDAFSIRKHHLVIL